jgi:hypothetical protein
LTLVWRRKHFSSGASPSISTWNELSKHSPGSG